MYNLSIIDEVNGFVVTATDDSWSTGIQAVDCFADSLKMSDQLKIKLNNFFEERK